MALAIGQGADRRREIGITASGSLAIVA